MGEGRTDDAGKFQFAEGRKIDFFVGSAANRITIGSATPGYTAAGVDPVQPAAISPKCRPRTATSIYRNLLRLLALLDANDDTHRRLPDRRRREHRHRHRRHRHETLDFAANAANFGNDAIVTALATAMNRTLSARDEALVRYQLLFRQSRSSSIALTGDDTRAVVVNRQKASVSVIRVRNTDGSDASQLLAEVAGGQGAALRRDLRPMTAAPMSPTPSTAP